MALKRTREQPRAKHRTHRKPKVGLRWGRIVLACLVLFGSGGGLYYALDGAGSNTAVQSTANKPTAPTAPRTTGNGTLPGDIFAENMPENSNPILAKAIQEREAALAAMRAANATAGEGAVNSALQSLAEQIEQPSVTATASPANPFAGKALPTITAELATHKFIGNMPEQWGEHLPGITGMLTHVWEKRHHPAKHAYGVVPLPTAGPVPNAQTTVALTLDACGGPSGSGYDAELIDFLRKERIPATLFLTSSWIKRNPMRLRDLAGDALFEIAAHGTAHKPASINGRAAFGIKGTPSLAALVHEVEGNARDIEKVTGKRPVWFRSGTAYYDDIAVAVIRHLGFGIAGFSIAGDEGASLKAAQVAAKVIAAQDGDILLLHMNKPQSGTREGLMQALPKLKEQGVVFVRLSR